MAGTEDDVIPLGQRGPGADPVRPPALDSAKAAATALDGFENDKKGATGLGPSGTFTLDFIDSRKRRWGGQFRFHVPTIHDRISIGLTKARMSGGLPASALDAATDELLEVAAYLSVVLDDSPIWAKPANLLSITDPQVLGAIYNEVAGYERRFRGTGGPEAGPVDDAV